MMDARQQDHSAEPETSASDYHAINNAKIYIMRERDLLKVLYLELS